MDPWQVPIMVALIGQLPVFATLARVNQVHGKVKRATNGQHDELVRGQQDLLRRLENLEEEMNVVMRAVVANHVERPNKRRWFRR